LASDKSRELPVELRSLGIDDLSDIRHVHATALRVQEAEHLREEQCDALIDYVRSWAHSDIILESMTLGAFYEGRLCGTAGWKAAEGSLGTARITSVCVEPLFAGLGLGSRLLRAIEAQAEGLGFVTLTVRTPPGASGFFQRLGYQISSHSTWMSPAGVSIPVAFLRKGNVQPRRDRRTGRAEIRLPELAIYRPN
jgi:GNAT superfamily N-acetyltransferase